MKVMDVTTTIRVSDHVDPASSERTGRAIGAAVVEGLRRGRPVRVCLDGLPLGFLRSNLFNALLDAVVLDGHTVEDVASGLEWEAADPAVREIATYAVKLWSEARSRRS